MRLLEGHVESSDERDDQIERLERENRELRDELQAAKREAMSARREAAGALSALRKQLSPLYHALQAVFGELDAAGVDDVQGSSAADPRWADWKNRLGPACAKLIDLLILQPEMTVKGMTIAAKMGQQTVYDATSKMGRAGILVKNGSKFSLKLP